MNEFPRPRNYPYKEVFYSDGSIAMMYGNYKGDDTKTVGLRWTQAESALGYPNVHGRGMWMVLPDKLALYILKGISADVRTDEDQRKLILSPAEFDVALQEVRERMNRSK